MWLIFLSWAYKALTSPSPREMFSPLFPVFVALKEERGGRKANKAPSFLLFLFFLLVFFFLFSFFLLVILFVSRSQNETCFLPSLPLLSWPRASRLHEGTYF